MTNKEYLMKNHFDELLDEVIGLCDVYDDCFADILIKIFPFSKYCFRCDDCSMAGCKKCIDNFLNKEYEEV